MLLIRTIVFLAVTFFGAFLVFQCGAVGHEYDAGSKIRVINNTSLHFTEVSLFSMALKDLGPRDTTSYVELSFDALKDDPLIYCTYNGKRMGRYVQIPEKGTGLASYVIDSLNNDIIYVSYRIDDKK
ncbi:hypothetical protein D2V93_08890 [Flagellimonas taeanensis]|uniref:hypothetical protein n=1 Tax=Flavobacteriaceae TaxID=49546 RepID=UPI000E68AD91|nr:MULTISPECIES: hypothetical protein [Allomuricauda]MDC6385744.1 hypothetical protein [Muricauda sp. SK9]RIV50968.1 hypothetical protein D2V93_08890 [Allomuricauda taeanensis]